MTENNEKSSMEVMKAFAAFLHQDRYHFHEKKDIDESTSEYEWVKEFPHSSYRVIVIVSKGRDEVLVYSKLRDEQPLQVKESKKFVLFKRSLADTLNIEEFKTKVNGFLAKIDDEELFEVKRMEKSNLVENDVRPDMGDSLKSHLTIAKKRGNATEYFYYGQLLDKFNKGSLMACSNFDKFINSFDGESWFKKNEKAIKDLMEQENSRFGKRFTMSYPKSYKNDVTESVKVKSKKEIIKESLDHFVSDNHDNRKIRYTVAQVNQALKQDGYKFLIAQREWRDSGLSKMWELRWAKQFDENTRLIVTIEIHTNTDGSAGSTIIGRGFVTETNPFEVKSKTSSWLYKDGKDGQLDPLVVVSRVENMLAKLIS